MKRKQSGKTRSSGKRAQKDLTARKASVTGGGMSDIGNEFQIKLQEANTLYTGNTPAPPPPPPPPPPAKLIRPR
jgi:hypothetical protein